MTGGRGVRKTVGRGTEKIDGRWKWENERRGTGDVYLRCVAGNFSFTFYLLRYTLRYHETRCGGKKGVKIRTR